MKEPKAPAGLSDAAGAWWRELIRSYEDWQPDELLRLGGALQAFDRWQAARAILDREGLSLVDRFGQPRVPPMVSVERDSRAACLLELRKLGLGDQSSPALSASEAGRKAAMMRWHRGVA
jgi:phage terminase small subunit